MATYTDLLDLQNSWVDGENIPDGWLETVADVLDGLLGSFQNIDCSGSANVTPDPDTIARANVLYLSGTLTGSIELRLPAWPGKRWIIVNGTSGAFTITAKPTGASGVTITQGYAGEVYCDGTDILRRGAENAGATTRLSGLILAGAVSSPPATAQNLTNSATITLPTGGDTKPLTATGGSVTGIILTAGTVDGQKLVLFNKEASNTITFAAAGTSNVADGTSAVLGALRAMSLVWDATSSRWYRA